MRAVGATTPATERPTAASVGGIDPAVLAAIVAAVDATWPRPGAEAPLAEPERWRFSSRWWSGPAAGRRRRPW